MHYAARHWGSGESESTGWVFRVGNRVADTLHGRPLQAAAVFGSRPCLLAALLTQGTARLAVSSRCMDNGVLPSQSTTWGCRTYFMSRMRGGVQFVPLLPRLLLFPIFFSIFFFFFSSLPFASFCSISVFSSYTLVCGRVIKKP